MKRQSPLGGRALRLKRSAPIDKAPTSTAESIRARPAKATRLPKFQPTGRRLSKIKSFAAGIASHAEDRPRPSMPVVHWLLRPIINDEGAR
jgi:hypothetical protein